MGISLLKDNVREIYHENVGILSLLWIYDNACSFHNLKAAADVAQWVRAFSPQAEG